LIVKGPAILTSDELAGVLFLLVQGQALFGLTLG
jgi:hypothetical protein